MKSAADSTSLEKQKDEDNLQVFFHSMIERMDETLIPEICGSFPLEENKVDNERFAGKNIFRKRAPEEELVDDENDKKPKLEVGSIDETAAEREEENGDVMDDLVCKNGFFSVRSTNYYLSDWTVKELIMIHELFFD